MSAHTDVLIFVEDPGAANYIAQLPAALSKKGKNVKLFANGYAKDYLLQRGLAVEKLDFDAPSDRVLASVNPGVVVVGTSENPDTVGLQLIDRARYMGIQSVGVIDALANSDYRFRGRSDSALTYAPDWLIIPDKWTQETYLDLGYPRERTIICGHPHYDYVREIAAQLALKDVGTFRQQLFPQVADDQKTVVFVAEISSGLYPEQFQRSEEYSLIGGGKSTGRTEIVIEEFLTAIQKLNSRPYLVLRLHPKNTRDEFAAYLNEFDVVSSGGAALELVYVTDLVVGMTSMLLLEAALLGKPTLSIVPRELERDWLPSIRMGMTNCVCSQQQLQHQLVTLLQQDSQDISPITGDDIVYGALEKVARVIERLLTTVAE